MLSLVTYYKSSKAAEFEFSTMKISTRRFISFSGRSSLKTESSSQFSGLGINLIESGQSLLANGQFECFTSGNTSTSSSHVREGRMNNPLKALGSALLQYLCITPTRSFTNIDCIDGISCFFMIGRTLSLHFRPNIILMKLLQDL